MSEKSRYPSYNVLDERDEWDEFTRSIVVSRLGPAEPYGYLTLVEAEMLRAVCASLVYDDKPEVIDYVVRHIDETLVKSRLTGEGQREVGVPPAPELIRQGLKAIEQSVLLLRQASFMSLSEADRAGLLRQMSNSAAEPPELWASLPQRQLFQKLCSLTIEAYCSHPAIWSEIGYGGPAYPRGYVRTQLGQLDPWEAKPE
ncbi:gluconate 2-dehydrogenase subunit 3 family protein [Paenibacillus ginsengarvi]|uniref:Gluconate 2-dehydrogenase subunit 3 family protein n=1 Tax=Paenibacillus ginsengarvi TaxID=400777 RepID=A0A3B0ARI0_9BACL|nr:gluconate 2-dehydrogenase subunit 3 family protein [Paenibacillus ginsengarvi]RKN62894.1 gluconate 2-dehydrogenase subunit 3 family protein [Paenibacillus ginsengarvi]